MLNFLLFCKSVSNTEMLERPYRKYYSADYFVVWYAPDSARTRIYGCSPMVSNDKVRILGYLYREIEVTFTKSLFSKIRLVYRFAAFIYIYIAVFVYRYRIERQAYDAFYKNTVWIIKANYIAALEILCFYRKNDVPYICRTGSTSVAIRAAAAAVTISAYIVLRSSLP